jgi:peroxiredoxin
MRVDPPDPAPDLLGEETEAHWRPPLVRRQRRMLAAALAAALAGLVVLGVAAVFLSPSDPPRQVTIPIADRNASPELVRAALAIGYRPQFSSGSMEDKPASAANEPSSGLLPIGSPAPPFTLPTPTGDEVRLASLRGKAVLLEFFATWCPHCASEASHLRSLYESLPKTKIAFVGVNGASEDAPSVFAYHVYFGLPFPALLDLGGGSVSWPTRGPLGPVTASYRVKIFPTFYILDPAGRVAWRGDGEQPDALLLRELKRAAGLGGRSGK